MRSGSARWLFAAAACVAARAAPAPSPAPDITLSLADCEAGRWVPLPPPTSYPTLVRVRGASAAGARVHYAAFAESWSWSDPRPSSVGRLLDATAVGVTEYVVGIAPLLWAEAGLQLSPPGAAAGYTAAVGATPAEALEGVAVARGWAGAVLGAAADGRVAWAAARHVLDPLGLFTRFADATAAAGVAALNDTLGELARELRGGGGVRGPHASLAAFPPFGDIFVAVRARAPSPPLGADTPGEPAAYPAVSLRCELNRVAVRYPLLLGAGVYVAGNAAELAGSAALYYSGGLAFGFVAAAALLAVLAYRHRRSPLLLGAGALAAVGAGARRLGALTSSLAWALGGTAGGGGDSAGWASTLAQDERVLAAALGVYVLATAVVVGGALYVSGPLHNPRALTLVGWGLQGAGGLCALHATGHAPTAVVAAVLVGLGRGVLMPAAAAVARFVWEVLEGTPALPLLLAAERVCGCGAGAPTRRRPGRSPVQILGPSSAELRGEGTPHVAHPAPLSGAPTLRGAVRYGAPGRSATPASLGGGGGTGQRALALSQPRAVLTPHLQPSPAPSEGRPRHAAAGAPAGLVSPQARIASRSAPWQPHGSVAPPQRRSAGAFSYGEWEDALPATTPRERPPPPAAQQAGLPQWGAPRAAATGSTRGAEHVGGALPRAPSLYFPPPTFRLPLAAGDGGVGVGGVGGVGVGGGVGGAGSSNRDSALPWAHDVQAAAPRGDGIRQRRKRPARGEWGGHERRGAGKDDDDADDNEDDSDADEVSGGESMGQRTTDSSDGEDGVAHAHHSGGPTLGAQRASGVKRRHADAYSVLRSEDELQRRPPPGWQPRAAAAHTRAQHASATAVARGWGEGAEEELQGEGQRYDGDANGAAYDEREREAALSDDCSDGGEEMDSAEEAEAAEAAAAAAWRAADAAAALARARSRAGSARGSVGSGAFKVARRADASAPQELRLLRSPARPRTEL